MYSHEIDDVMRNNNYKIPSSLYMNICKNSPQINGIERKNDSQYCIYTNDNYNWLFELYNDSETFL